MKQSVLTLAIAVSPLVCQSAIADVTPLQVASIDTLDEVVVTSTRSETTAREAPGAVTVINRRQIEEKGGGDVLDAIRGTPGVSLIGVGSGGRKTLSLRGLESKHTLILIDGKRLPASNDVLGPNTDYQYDWIPLEEIERIEVVRGPMSVLYGSDALGGVINIITRQPDKTSQGSVKLAGLVADGDAGGDGHDAEVRLSGKLGRSARVQLNASHKRRGAVSSAEKAPQSVIEGREQQQLGLNLDWAPLEGQQFSLDIETAQEDRWLNTVNRRNTLYQSRYDIDRQQVALGWEGGIGETTAALRAYRNEIDVANQASNGVRPTSPQNLQDSVVEGQVIFPVGERQAVTAGAEYRAEKLEHPKLPGGENEFVHQSIYLQDEIDASNNAMITLGARLDDHEAFGQETSPRAAIVWQATKQLTLKASYGHGFRAPTIKQVTPGYSFPGGIFLITSNPDLKPETSDAVELGMILSKKRYNLSLSVFNNEVKDLIDTRFDAPLPGGLQRWVFDNIDKARFRGGELGAQIEPVDGVDIDVSYQYLDAHDGDGERLERRPRHTLSAGVAWEKNAWRFDLSTEYLADQVIVPPRSRKMTDVPDYALWHAGAHRKIGARTTLGLTVDNLTDVRLEEKSSAFRHEEYPRTFRLEIRSRFR